ncbi:FAD-dependent oxidoreductase [Brevibacterium renqingii]|uniref:FAD-dependent oxidoreductase n=1 Tax=Brevibacterium renqingii TaxID=2776916 RepID=UPI001ADEFE45|nr:NAD(P)/FAD-dependent oxidoreductase [Brevibacterium renqingii]
MITAASVGEQLESVSAETPRILIVGAGIAGITLAQLLRVQGFEPVLVDRSADARRMIGDNRAGYMLALMPMVDPIIDALGVRDTYLDASVGIDRYVAHAHSGRVLRQDRLGDLLAEYGDYRGISRAALLTVLTGDDCPVAFGTTVSGLAEDERSVTVTWGDDSGAAAESARTAFDIVVIADGMNSRTRDLAPSRGSLGAARSADAVDTLDTAWGGWVCWADADGSPDAVDEIWGDGFFLGMYPVKDGIGVFLGCPDSREPLGSRRFADEVRAKLKVLPPRIDACLAAIATARDPFFWPLRDSRARRWAEGRTVLLGDAAAGFLPTAGIGAGMAMESAHMLARAIAAGRDDPVTALKRFEDRQRPRVEAAHENSRALAGLMFDRSRLLAAARDQVFRILSIRTALKPILKLLETPAEQM